MDIFNVDSYDLVGHLLKKGKKTLWRQKWRERFFCINLSEGTLSYFKSSKLSKTTFLKTLILANFDRVEACQLGEEPYGIKLVGPKRTFEFAANSQKDQKNWIEKLTQALANSKKNVAAKPSTPSAQGPVAAGNVEGAKEEPVAGGDEVAQDKKPEGAEVDGEEGEGARIDGEKGEGAKIDGEKDTGTKIDGEKGEGTKIDKEKQVGGEPALPGTVDPKTKQGSAPGTQEGGVKEEGATEPKAENPVNAPSPVAKAEEATSSGAAIEITSPAVSPQKEENATTEWAPSPANVIIEKPEQQPKDKADSISMDGALSAADKGLIDPSDPVETPQGIPNESISNDSQRPLVASDSTTTTTVGEPVEKPVETPKEETTGKAQDADVGSPALASGENTAAKDGGNTGVSANSETPAPSDGTGDKQPGNVDFGIQPLFIDEKLEISGEKSEFESLAKINPLFSKEIRNDFRTVAGDSVSDRLDEPANYLRELQHYLSEGILVKKLRPNGKAHLRAFWVTSDGFAICWCDDKREGKVKSMQISNITDIIPGAETKVMKRGIKKEKLDPNLCFSIISQKRTLDWIFDTVEKKNLFYNVLVALRRVCGLGLEPFRL